MTTNRWLWVLLAAALAGPAPAQDGGPAPKSAAVRLPVLVVLPMASDDATGREYAMLLQARAYGQLLATGRFALPHIKQVLGMAAGEGLKADQLKSPEDAEHAAKRLGADGYLFGQLTSDAKGYSLTASALMLGKKPQPVSLRLDLGTQTVKAIEEGGDALASALYKVARDDKQPLELQDVPPSTLSDSAMRSFGRCYGTLMRQPAGIENPTVLDEVELRGALVACQEAAKEDPGFSGARAGLAYAYAILGDDAKAVKALSLVWGADAEQPLAWQAQFWLVTRYKSGEAGELVLRDALARQPGFLLARSYLAELLDTLAEDAKAGEAWKEYSGMVPGDPFIRTRLARSLARQGRLPEAIAITAQVVEKNPTSRDAKLQLASRFIEANRWDEAMVVLEELRALPGASPEVFLRLGWATFRKGDSAAARALYEEALARAKGPGQWRMRGRANYDLALVHLKNGEGARAEEALKAALATGFRLREVDPLAQPLLKKIERADLSRTKSGVPWRPLPLAPPLPREVSLFPLDPYGEVDPFAKPKAPEGFMWSTGDFK